ADVELTLRAHLGGAGIAEVRVVRPNDDAAAARSVASSQMSHKRIDRLGHMPIAQVPRRDASTEHRAVVGLGITCQARILLGEEELVLRYTTVPVGEVAGPPLELHQLTDGFVLTRLGDTQRGLIAVD